jgi:hypothetical protein
MSQLNNNDYKEILEYYGKPIPKSNRLLKNAATKILATKLCKCIKKVGEPRSIGICTKSVINKKGLTRGKFTCKKKISIVLQKKNSTRRK